VAVKEIRIAHSKIRDSQKITDVQEQAFREAGLDMHRDELTGEHHRLTLVYPHEANVETGRVSVLAPVGSALLGLSVGQTIDWQASGNRSLRLRVTAIDYQPEASGDLHR